jgi:serine/threonine protein phosphatase PrpC
MVTCPQCGQSAPDDQRFCDRCGQGLGAAAAPAGPPSPQPLTPGTMLKGGYEIVELIGRSLEENRYRAIRRGREKTSTAFQLRERIAPDCHETARSADRSQASPQVRPPVVSEDPNGPRAKTAELKLPAPQPKPPAPTPNVAREVASGEAAIIQSDATASTSAAVSTIELDHPVSDLPVSDLPVSDLIDSDSPPPPIESTVNGAAPSESESRAYPQPITSELAQDDLGELFGRVMALSLTIDHPGFYLAIGGFADRGRVYLAYPDEKLNPISRAALPMREADAIQMTIQLCQIVGHLNKRGLRANDICPDSLAIGENGRLRLTSLDYVSNDLELQSEPILNDGYTAPEIYRGKEADKRADVFSAGSMFYTVLTGARIAAESWREDGGSIQFYPPFVVSPPLEQLIRRAVAFRPADRWANVDAMKAELMRLDAAFRLKSGSMTDVGMVRDHNEDALMVVEFTRDSLVEPASTYLYVVSDGMGGAAAGEVASAIALGTIREHIESRPAAEVNADLSKSLYQAIEAANSKILEYAAAHEESRGMGATVVAALIAPPNAALGWVGDSRIYLSSSGDLRQLTKDHSLVARLVEIGQITAEQARSHEHKNVITRSLGARPKGPAGAEVISVRLKRGDRLMLCSDGLTTHVADHQINDILNRNPDPATASRELVVAANAGGGTDNISVIVIAAE